jgi:hypothetical protein
MRDSAPAGVVGQNFAAEPDTSSPVAGDDPLWEGYLDAPVAERLGICCSGGGVRSASFSLGALQVLREKHLLERADHLSCVSGGGYITIAHAVMVSESLKRAAGPAEPPQPAAVENIEQDYFGRRAPWARDSPEESHLRNHISYLGSRVWLVANLIYGTIRHLLPFAAAIYLFGFVVGVAMSPWLADTLQVARGAVCKVGACVTNADLLPFVWLSAALLVLAGLLLALRNTGQKKAFADGPMFLLQYLTLALLYTGSVVFGLLVVMPWVFLRLHSGALESIGPFANIGVDGASLTAIAGLVGSVVSWIAKKRTTRWFQIGVAVLTALAGPIFVLVPTIGIGYWNARWGTDWGHDPQRLWIAAGSAAYLLVMWLGLDEVTSVAHLFYRERLATAFVGYRRLVAGSAGSTLEYTQPPWDEDLDFTGLAGGSGVAKLPNLVVCAAVNLSGDLPVGRMGASFTFERDKVGGPATGYVPTAWMEAQAGPGVATLPALMAISGAAVAPSMGKMTIRALRFLMAVFDLRLGAWLPNPTRAPMSASARELRSNTPGSKDPSAGQPRFGKAWRRPGALYVFREALGLNSIRRSFVYVTDGGHWENLGLVELLRRGCSRIVCIDGSGGNAMTFGTLSEAIALARSDLGVEISIDLSEMHAETGELSKSGFAFGRIEFPDDTTGTLVYIRALLTETSPEDLRSYAGKDKKFPNHPTSDQFFDEERFEAYRALGQHLMEQAIACRAATIEVPPTAPPCP